MASSTGVSSSSGDVAISSDGAFSCATCGSNFVDSSTQRAHMRSEWHVYNLKRRIANLASISFDVFETQVQAAKASEQQQNLKTQQRCAICDKDFVSEKKYSAHLNSASHSQRLQKVGSGLKPRAVNRGAVEDDDGEVEPADAEAGSGNGSSDAEDEDDFESTTCLFCNQSSRSLHENTEHMHKAHGLFIPDQQHLIDLDSFLGYLSFLISEFHECLYCESIKGSPEAAKHHMTSKGHCRINFEGTARWEEFYDYPEGREHVVIKSDTDQQLRLSSGKTVSHRSQPRQNHSPSQLIYSSKDSNLLEGSSATNGTPAEGAVAAQGDPTSLATSRSKPSSSREARVSKQLTVRSGDSQGLIGISDVQKRALRAVEKKMTMLEVRARMEYQRKVEKGGNKQPFFRPDNPGGRTNG